MGKYTKFVKKLNTGQIMAKKKHKYGAKPKNGFASTKEANRAASLRLLEKLGEISDLWLQVEFVLLPKQEVTDYKGKIICGRREMKYVADFAYLRNGVRVVEDCKGYKTPEYLRKKRLMLKIHGIEIFET